MLDDVGNLVGGQSGVDGNEDPSGLRNAEVCKQERLRIKGQKGDAIALSKPRIAQGRGARRRDRARKSRHV